MNFKKVFYLFSIVCSVLFFVSCASTPPKNSLKAEANTCAAPSPLHVLSTTGMIHDLVREVGGSFISTEILINENLDPHTYELVKGDGEKLSKASIIFYNGLGLEHSPNLFKQLKNHPNNHAIGDYIASKFSEEIVYIDGQVDPHIWMNVALWKEGVDLIVEVLSEADPQNQATYRANGQALNQEMNQAHDSIYAMMQQVPSHQRYLVTCHDAFNYFTRAYLCQEEEVKSDLWKERCKSPEGLSPDSQLSLADIQEVVGHLKKYDIQMVFPEANVNLNSIKKIKEATRKMGLNVHVSPYLLYADSLSQKGEPQDTYLKMIRYNAEIIAKCLKTKTAYENSQRSQS